MSISFFILLFIVALLYASVGHGGASGYLALMAIYGFAPEVMKPSALILNLFVSLTSFIMFYKGGHFKWKLFLPFAFSEVEIYSRCTSVMWLLVKYSKGSSGIDIVQKLDAELFDNHGNICLRIKEFSVRNFNK